MASVSYHVASLMLLTLVTPWITPTSAIAAEKDLKIGAFNVQLFGKAVMSNQDIVEVLKTVVQRYDIILIQEIRDISGEAIVSLLDQVNEVSGDAYRMNISDRLGRTNSKEQYAFLYRKDRVEVVSAYHYDDGEECPACEVPPDQFQREPYVVVFRSAVLENIETFALAAIHTQPTDAVQEIDYLVDVYEDITQKYNLYDVMILGDFNAACTYVGGNDWPNIRLWTQHVPEGKFDWLISTAVDTTVGPGYCAYDRIVVSGEMLRAAVVPGSAQAFYFDKEYDINGTFTPEVSDHYPVEVELKGKVNPEVTKNIKVSDTFVVSDLRPTSSVSYIRKIYLASNDAGRGMFSAERCFKSTGGSLEVTARRTVDSRDEVMIALREFTAKIPQVLSEALLEVVEHRMEQSALTAIYTHPAADLLANTEVNKYRITITCPLVVPYVCEVEVRTAAGLE